MKPDKNTITVTIAMIVSILALIISIFSFMGSNPKPASAPARSGTGGGGGMPGGGMGGGMRSFAPSPEYIASFEEKAGLLKSNAEQMGQAFAAGTSGAGEVFNARLEYDEARLMLQRLKNDRRAFSSFVDTLLRITVLEYVVKDAGMKYETGNLTLNGYNELRIKLLDEKLRLHEQSRRVGAETLAKAGNLIKDYLDKGLTDGQIAELVELEPSRGGR